MTTVVETKEENSKTEEELEREWEEERLEAKRKEERKLVELGMLSGIYQQCHKTIKANH
jgi:hypothetical protein